MIEAREEPPFRRERLAREIAVIVVLKLAALTLLWVLFFSGAHELAVGAQEASRHLGLPELARAGTLPAAPAPATAHTAGETP